ncbi:MAG: hypothetical protein ACI9IJ_001900, partial [Psychromonas sp.]
GCMYICWWLQRVIGLRECVYIYWGVRARESICVTSGDVTEEMNKEYLARYFEPKVDDDFRTEH